jgi:hypothetical protein
VFYVPSRRRISEWRNFCCFQEYETYDEAETTEVEQQALLPSVKDPKLWMVKCNVCIKDLALVLGPAFTAVNSVHEIMDRMGIVSVSFNYSVLRFTVCSLDMNVKQQFVSCKSS